MARVNGTNIGMLTIDKRNLQKGLRHLAATDPELAAILKQFGPPPIWGREPGFPTLVHIILEQQVSLASARAAFNRLLERVVPLTPVAFLELDDESLRKIGFSRQKSHYTRILADSLVSGRIDLDAVHAMDDLAAKQSLVSLKGIGHWTADIYLLMAMRRPDIWPLGDLALAVALQKVKGLHSRPSNSQLEEIGEAWRPWRAVAARLLWHYYLSAIRPTKS
jgi:DNA-3-methyladenine glycosylase II